MSSMPSAVSGPVTAAVVEQARRAERTARSADGGLLDPAAATALPGGRTTGQLPFKGSPTAAEKRRVTDTEGARRADLAAIHLAKKALGWDDGTYRDVMATVCRVRSAADMDFTARKRFLEHLRKCQAQMGIKPRGEWKPQPWSPPLRALWSLWQRLADAGLVHDRSRDALQAWVKRQAGVDRLEWLTTHQLDALLASARLWLGRAGKETR